MADTCQQVIYHPLAACDAANGPPADASENSCYLGSFCTEQGTCEYEYQAAGASCDLSDAQEALYEQGCTPDAFCRADGIGGTTCVPEQVSAISRVKSFTLVDAEANITSYELLEFSSDVAINYRDYDICNYNIRVNVQDCGQQVDSVLIDWDGKLSCEKTTPYSVFFDSNPSNVDLGPYGKFDNEIMSLGTHVLTATPFSGSNCNGTSGEPLTVAVDVSIDGVQTCPGGVANMELYDADSDKVVSSLVTGMTVCPPKNYTVRACQAPCYDEGEIKWMYFQLFNMSSATLPYPLVRSYNDTTKKDFFLFDKIPGDILGGPRIPNGHYKLTATPYGNYVNSQGHLISYAEGLTQEVIFNVYC